MQKRVFIGIAVIVGLVGYLAFIGFKEGKTYYHTCDEVAAMGAKAVDNQIRLAGRVVDGSIHKDGDILRFDLEYQGARFPIQYVGMDPVPDTFKDGVDAVVDGKLGQDGVFVGNKIQAKCASKYEADYNKKPTPGAKDGSTA